MGRGCWLLLQVLGQILLIINQADSSPANKTIRIGYLLQFKYVAGAINVAVEQAQNDGLLRGYNFRYPFKVQCGIISNKSPSESSDPETVNERRNNIADVVFPRCGLWKQTG